MSDPDDPYDDVRLFAQFEKMGAPEVTHMTGQWSGRMREAAFRWLHLKAQEDRSRMNASISEQIKLARESNAIALAANAIAHHAKTLAIATLIVAIIGAIAAIMAPVIR